MLFEKCIYVQQKESAGMQGIWNIVINTMEMKIDFRM